MISNEDIQARKLDIALNRGASESSGSGLSYAHPSLIVSTTNFTDRPFSLPKIPHTSSTRETTIRSAHGL